MLSLATAFRMGVAFLNVKLIAMTIGPLGIGLLGQYYSLIYIATALAGGGVAIALPNVMSKTPYVGSRERDKNAEQGFTYAILFSLFGAVLYSALAYPISKKLLGGSNSAYIALLGLVQIALAYSNYKTTLLNFVGRQKTFAVLSVYSAILSTVIVACGCAVGTINSVIVAVLLSNVSTAVVLLIKPTDSQIPKLRMTYLNRTIVSQWFPYAALSLASVIGMPVAYMLVRAWLGKSSGWNTVGQWQAMIRLSDAYFQFLIIFLTGYFYPKLAIQPTYSQKKATARSMLALLIPMMLVSACLIYAAREIIIRVLFSKAFSDTTAYFLPQLIGDVFKAIAYVLGYVILSSGRKRISFSLELFQAAVFLALTWFVGLNFGGLGVAWSYTVTYLVYFAVVAYLVFGVKVDEA